MGHEFVVLRNIANQRMCEALMHRRGSLKVIKCPSDLSTHNI